MTAATAVVLAGGGTAYAVVGGEVTPNYRTVKVAEGDVEQTLSFAGLVDAAQRADLSFGTGGTVDTVKVGQGDTVKAGQVIATLETDGLDSALTEAKAALAKAKALLESDQNAQTSSVQQASSSSSNPSGGSGQDQPSDSGSSGSGSGASAALLKKLKEQQQAVLDAQSAASAALTAAHDALAAQTAACADAYQTPAPPSADATATPDASAADDSSAANAACDSALADVETKQAVVNDAQDALADALTNLSKTLSSALGSVTNGQGSTPIQSSARTSATSAASQTPTTTGATGSDGASAGSTITAARLASDQAQIDQANADLVSARADRAQATLRSTRSGRVVSLDLERGDAVSTGTAVAVVVGGKSVTLAGTVAETSVERLKVGQVARISVPGSSTTTTGTVTAIGMTADSTSGSTTYPVTVTVEDPTIALPTGSRAQVAVVLSTAKDVVTLPISAISKIGNNTVVRVWDGTTLTRTPVTLGAIGTRSVQVDGVKKGTEVVLADVDQAVTGASTELDQRGNFSGPPGSFTTRNGGGGGPVTLTSKG